MSLFFWPTLWLDLYYIYLNLKIMPFNKKMFTFGQERIKFVGNNEDLFKSPRGQAA